MTKATDISIQFYATPAEVREFIETILIERGIHVTKVRANPFQAEELNQENLAEAVDGSFPCRVYLTLDRPNTSSSKEDFERSCSDPLILDVGQLDEVGLHQSCLACRVFDPEVKRVWQQVAKVLKQITEEGATATNRLNGISQYYKSFRHTSGARKLQENGVNVIPPQGQSGPLMRLGK